VVSWLGRVELGRKGREEEARLVTSWLSWKGRGKKRLGWAGGELAGQGRAGKEREGRRGWAGVVVSWKGKGRRKRLG
jgi:hypothetical protein